MSSRHLTQTRRSTYVDVRQMDDPAEFLNIVDMFKRTYYIYAPKKVNERQLQSIIHKYGIKHVRYALGVLSDQYISDADSKQPYRHFDLVVSRMKKKYDEKVASSTRSYR